MVFITFVIIAVIVVVTAIIAEIIGSVQRDFEPIAIIAVINVITKRYYCYCCQFTVFVKVAEFDEAMVTVIVANAVD